MTATNNDHDRFHCCGYHGIPCGRHGIGPSGVGLYTLGVARGTSLQESETVPNFFIFHPESLWRVYSNPSSPRTGVSLREIPA